ncbi:MAG: LTA synthase family protein [Bacilli bacterium]|nr:LTA synthase family protein [Bacilli bacterium]
MKKISLLVVYFLSFIYMEFLYRILVMDKVFRLSNINMLLFLIFFALFFFMISKLFKEKENKIIFYTSMSIIGLWFSAQFVVKSFFDFYISFSVLQIADQVGDFLSIAVVETAKRLWGVALIYIPVILAIIFRKRISFKQSGWKKTLIIALCTILSYGIYYVGLNIGKSEDYSAYDLYHSVNNPSLNVEKVGVLNTFVVDTYRAIFGFEEKLVLNVGKPAVKDPLPEEIVYNFNNLDIDFENLKNNTNDQTIKTMTEYFESESGTLQNEYTGIFEGKNLIMVMAESFNEIAVRKDTTPTLYKLVNSGFVFDNFYSPTIYSTIGGEFQYLTGLYANFSSLSQFRSGKNSFPMGVASMFQEKGYNTFAYHNNSYVFQDRNVYLNRLGFDNYKGCYNGLEKLMNCGQWPQSDVEMIDVTYTDFINSEEPFMVFYASVSGHAGYSWGGNAASRKHRAEIESLNLGYTEPVLAYLAAQMELDRALEQLITKLEESGQLENTVIALVGDHYPYALTVDEVNTAATYQKDGTVEINRSNFILWNSEMETKHIEKVGSQIDVLPTIYNAFGLEYDSRLIIGKDILSTEPGLAMFGDNSWVSDYGTYFASSGNFKAKKEVEEDYVKTMNQIVRNKITMSKYIMDKNYYKTAWDYIK